VYRHGKGAQVPLHGGRRLIHEPTDQGVYHTGADQARYLTVLGDFFGCGTLSFIASYMLLMLQRHTGLSIWTGGYQAASSAYRPSRLDPELNSNLQDCGSRSGH
jgi:hypothetical protein